MPLLSYGSSCSWGWDGGSAVCEDRSLTGKVRALRVPRLEIASWTPQVDLNGTPKLRMRSETVGPQITAARSSKGTRPS